MNLSGVWWASEYMYGRKPFPTQKKKDDDGFAEVFAEELEKLKEDQNETSDIRAGDKH